MNGPRLNPDLLNVPIYVAGKSADQVKAELGLNNVIKLASNESPVGPSPLAMEAAIRMLRQAHRYPGLVEKELRGKVAAHLDPELDESNIVVGNGGTDTLRMITQAFVFNGGNTIMSRATFPMYRILTATYGGTPHFIDLTPDYRNDLQAMADQIDDETRIVYLCSPNNPTGLIITQAEADEFMTRVPDHVVVVFDESYYDYVTDPKCANTTGYIKKGLNVLAVRSFSKTAGLANMRVGYLIGSAKLAQYLQHTRLPFHLGDIALAAASASLDDEAYRTRHLEAVITGRVFLKSALEKMGLRCLPSQANFVVIVDLPMAPELLIVALLRRGIIVRPMAAFGLPDAFRVSVGKPHDNQKFIEVLGEVLEEAK